MSIERVFMLPCPHIEWYDDIWDAEPDPKLTEIFKKFNMKESILKYPGVLKLTMTLGENLNTATTQATILSKQLGCTIIFGFQNRKIIVKGDSVIDQIISQNS